MTQVVETAAAFDGRELRAALGRFATGVAVVTTIADGEPVGMTVNSLCSVSIDPPLLLFCVGHRSQLHSVFAAATHFAVHVLGSEQAGVCRQFARPGRSRFGDLPWRPGVTGAPVLDGALAALECGVDSVIPAGDHDILIGDVRHLHPIRDEDPLLFFAGALRNL